MRQALLRLPRRVDSAELHRLVYDRFAADGRRDFIFTPLDTASGPAVLVRGDIDVGDPVTLPAAGEEFGFLLRATPSVKSGDRRGAIQLHDRTRRIEWLRRRGADAGFELLDATVANRPDWIRRGDRDFWIDECWFSGRLRVGDPEKFAHALRHGVARGAKAFGYGCIVLKPPI